MNYPFWEIRMPEIEVKNDYDGYFESLVRDWCKEKEDTGKPFKHEKIIITAGPYRQAAMSYLIKDKEIILDFYSAIRNGFGGFAAGEIEQILELL